MTSEEKMTPEEAIAEISFLKVAVNKVMEQALDMAIKALSQEPIKYWIDHNGHVIPIQQPSVTQKSGKWIAHSDGGIWIKYYECSECGRGHDTHSDYCPNCGAKMESEEISERNMKM